MKDRTLTGKQIQILDVAEQLIAEKGFDGTSVREICTKAKVNVAMISYYFGSKEKMLAYLYQYRVQKTKDNFSEFAHTIAEGRPEMQMKEFIKFVITQMFKYSYFHGFVKHEIRHLALEDELLLFYEKVVERIDEVVKKGVAMGVFHSTPRPEDILINIIGPTLFVIRNDSFYKKYLNDSSPKNFLPQAEERMIANAYQTIFSILGYRVEE